MHKWGKEILECVKAKVEAIGIDNFEGQNLDDLKDWTEIAKNIACFDKDYRIVEAMDKAEDEEEIMEMIERYEDYPGRRHYDNYRYKTSGRFAPRGKGSSTDWRKLPNGKETIKKENERTGENEEKKENKERIINSIGQEGGKLPSFKINDKNFNKIRNIGNN